MVAVSCSSRAGVRTYGGINVVHTDICPFSYSVLDLRNSELTVPVRPLRRPFIWTFSSRVAERFVTFTFFCNQTKTLHNLHDVHHKNLGFICAFSHMASLCFVNLFDTCINSHTNPSNSCVDYHVDYSLFYSQVLPWISFCFGSKSNKNLMEKRNPKRFFIEITKNRRSIASRKK